MGIITNVFAKLYHNQDPLLTSCVAVSVGLLGYIVYREQFDRYRPKEANDMTPFINDPTEHDGFTKDEMMLLHDPFDLPHIPFKHFLRRKDGEMVQRAREFYELMNARRSVRMFSDEPVPIEAIRDAIRTAGTSPSGAHTEPWTFVVVGDKALKQEIRRIVEQEEKVNYDRRMSRQWVKDLAPLRTNWEKEYLSVVPYIIVVFKKAYDLMPDSKRRNNYYYEQSTAIACGLLIAALHNAGMATLTSTPMNAGPDLAALLGRPEHEKVALLLPVGYPAKDCTIPNLKRKAYEEIATEFL
ncbi:uncharacterized protein VTP21DRAFT_8183 [Calcarisporiella thermophila]|uniref:uncharacterized protein n=1 Tax=Calcarisporiella thermophila TaxID=911321 RepID=UPI0037428D4B